MRISDFIEDQISEHEYASIHRILKSETEIFSELARVAELDPSSDFRFSDLAGIDFRNSDLRGFDFTGADLRGSHGIDIIWDDTTNFSNADVSGSVFAYEISKREFLSDNVWRSEFNRRKKDYWPNNIHWFSEKLGKNSHDRAATLELAKALCDETKDTFLRSQLLFFMAPAFDDAMGHRDYLVHTLSKYSKDNMTVRVTLQTLSSIYINDKSIYDLMISNLAHKDHLIRDEAMKGILKSRFLRHSFDLISSIVPRFGIAIRQAYLLRAGALFGAQRELLIDGSGRAYDINEVISNRTIERSAILQLRHEDLRKLQSLRSSGSAENIPDPKRARVLERSAMIRSTIQRLIKLGVPMRLERLARAEDPNDDD